MLMNTINCSCGNTNSCSCGCCKSCNFQPCAVTCAPCCGRGGDYAYIYNTEAQTVAANSPVTASANGPLSGTITHTAGTAEVVIGETGVYIFHFYAAPEAEAQFSAYRNGTPIQGATFSGDEIMGQFIVAAQIGDVITFVNTGEGEATFTAQGTADEAVVNTSLTVLKVF